jgi:hypothetical protein
METSGKNSTSAWRSSLKRCAVVLGIAVLLLTLIPVTTSAAVTEKFWALIVEADYELVLDPGYMEYVLRTYYPFGDEQRGGILYIRGYPNEKEDVRKGVTEWLAQHSTSNDLVFIFIDGHGGGYDEMSGEIIGGRVDGSNGDPIDELDGVDECIKTCMWQYAVTESYWDDELREDLTTVNYARLVVMITGCKTANGTEGCYSGGFIRDLSAKNRIIITPTDEYHVSWGMPFLGTDKDYSYFGREFINALNPEVHLKLNRDGYPVIDPETGEPVWVNGFNEADTHKIDGKVSMWEAFQYACENDPAVEGFWKPTFGYIHETPQLDDNGDKVANYLDCSLSVGTYFGSEAIKSTDVNGDGLVDVEDLGAVALAWQSSPGNPNWNPYVDFDNNGFINIIDVSIVALDYGKGYE